MLHTSQAANFTIQLQGHLNCHPWSTGFFVQHERGLKALITTVKTKHQN